MKRIGVIVIVAVTVIAGVAPAAETGYYSQPALYGDRIVFASEGDLWTASIPAEAGSVIAYRLTTSDGEESRPQISGDGQQLAFAGQYDGNTDVYIMSIDGSSPTRLTFHPDPDHPVGWTPDGRSVLFRSQRANPLGRWELYRVPVTGGMPIRYNFGECSLAGLSSTGSRIAFTRWSNESWTWKRYRGGTAPDIWIGDLSAETFAPLTTDRASDLFPMWVAGRVFFLSDRTGTANIFSDSPDGGDLKQHTRFAPVVKNPTAREGYDVRWPSADAQRRGTKIVFAQAGNLLLLDTLDDSVRALDVRIASDRVASRQRFTDPMEMATEYSLSPDGKSLIVDSRGELLSVTVKPGTPVQLTRSSQAREWGASYLTADRIVLISDAAGEQQIAAAPADGSALPSLVTQDREAWLFPPVGSPDGQSIAFGDKTLRLHVLNMATLARRQVDQSDAWEITDYRFSPDSQWLAYVKPMPNGYGMISLYSIQTQRTFAVSDGLSNDGEPRWDPAGKYLYFLSKRKLDPIMDELDFDATFINTTGVYVVPLSAETPPPLPEPARMAGFDLEKWSSADDDEKDKSKDKEKDKTDAPKPAGAAAADADAAAAPAPGAGAGPAGADAKPADPMRMTIDTDGLSSRVFAIPIPAGNYNHLEAIRGAICYLSQSKKGLLTDDFGKTGLGRADHALHRYNFVDEEDKTVVEKTSGYALSRDCKIIAYPTDSGFNAIDSSGSADKPKQVDMKPVQLRINVREEWEQILNEAWRLQRDFYWAPNYVGVDWPAMKIKYAALLPRVGTRNELNDLIGQMIGELGTSHTYIWGGQQQDQAPAVSVGLLGADVELDPAAPGFRIVHIIPGQAWDESQTSPLGQPYLKVKEGNYILAVNGVTVTPSSNLYDLLQDQAEKTVRLTIADDAAGTKRRTIEVKTLKSERDLRYAAWVEANRAEVDKASDGKLGYLHLPDMDAQGLISFGRMFYPQFTKKGLVVDIRDNGGGFVSQIIISRLGRKVWAFQQPRQGSSFRYPEKTLYGYMAVLIDQHAGSDGDIFPESFRLNQLGPLIGTRTWGGVVGIRADKPFVDFGVSTQPEFAWWEPKRGWSLENEGVSPDIEVQISPQDRIAGRDPQLKTAIDWLLNKLKDSPMELPPTPPWPVRAK